MKNLVSKLCSPTGLDLGTPRMAAEAGGPALSAQALKEMAMSTKSIALIAATRRSKAQDREGGSGHSSLHLPEEVALDSRDPKVSVTPNPSPADRRRSLASPGRDCSAERKPRRKRSPSLTWSAQPVGGHWPPSPVAGSSWDGREGGSGLTPPVWWRQEGPGAEEVEGGLPPPPPV